VPRRSPGLEIANGYAQHGRGHDSAHATVAVSIRGLYPSAGRYPMLTPCGAWCGERITLGVVTPGGIVYHAACWRRRILLLRNAKGQG
jgi:hypothetical protein